MSDLRTDVVGYIARKYGIEEVLREKEGGTEAEMGRPKKFAGVKDRRVEVRIAREDEQMLSYICKKTGVNRTDFFRNSIEREYRKLVKKEENE